MRLRTPAVVLVLATLLGPACGKKGPILPPLILRPQPVESLRAVQRGGRVLLEWENPKTSIDGTGLSGIAEVEVWLETRPDPPPPKAPPLADDFSARARRVGTVVPAAGEETSSTDWALDPAGWKGRLYVFAVRVRESRKRRLSDFSNEAAVRPRAAPLPPSDAKARVYEDRVEIGWTDPVRNFDGSAPAAVAGIVVYRSEANGPTETRTPAPVRGPVFVDRDFLFGRTYRYVLRAAMTGGAALVESDDGPALEVKPVDTFPPAVPAALSIAAGPDFLTLVWDASPAMDLAGYHVWRRPAGSGEFVRLTAAPILETTYTDRAVDKGRPYEYVVTAVDAAGNESPRSAPVVQLIKDLPT